MTRTDNIKRNLIYNVIKYVTQLVLQFVLRTVLIYKMGVEYLGLNGLFTNIFAFLNLTELGIGTAIVYSMYKPISENDVNKVKSLHNVFKKFYLFISLIVLVVGLGITPFINSFISGGVTVDINIYLLYVLYLVNTLVGYLGAHKRSLLFAYQQNFVENKVRTISNFIMTIIQIGAILIFNNYYIYYSFTIACTLLECVLIHISANKLHPEINGKSDPLDKKTKKELTKNITALSMHKIGTVIVSSTDSILISMLFGVVVLGAYSNYFLIQTSLIAIFTLVIFAIMGSVGNLIASCDTETVYKKYKQINFIFAYLSAFTTICSITLFQSFINKWTGGGEYLLPLICVIFMCLSFYLSRMRSTVAVFKESSGLFWQNRWSPIVEAIVNLLSSVVLAKLIGITGIFIGTIISFVVAPLWTEPKVLYKYYFKKSVKEYYKRYLLDFIIMVCVAIICYVVCTYIPDASIWWLICKFAVCIVLSNILLVVAYFKTNEFKEVWQLLKDIIKSTFLKKKHK